jgi:hypothetical protein
VRRLAALTVALVLVGCSAPARTADPVVQTQLPSSTIDPAVAMTWPAPDDKLTPGLTDADCTSYPRPDDERYVSASTKRAAARRYNYTGPSGLQYVEYDHRIPFSLCGADTVANIWPQPTDGVKQTAFVYNRKDQLEAFAARQVRYKKWTLEYAQEVIRGDWRLAWCRYLHYPGVECP